MEKIGKQPRTRHLDFSLALIKFRVKEGINFSKGINLSNDCSMLSNDRANILVILENDSHRDTDSPRGWMLDRRPSLFPS